MTANDNSTIEMNTLPADSQSSADSQSPALERSATASAPVLPEQGVNNDGDGAPKKRWYQNIVLRKIGYALIALVIAVTVWGYVLMSQNPARTKRIENVRLSVDGGSEAGLRSRNLIIVDDLTSILPTVTVNVSTTLKDLPRFSTAIGDVVTATINLNDIRSPGVYVRQITATSTIGTPISIEPSTVTINVENYVTRDIPITYSFENTVEDLTAYCQRMGGTLA